MFLQRFLSPVEIDSIPSRLGADALTVFKHWRYTYFEAFVEQGFKLYDERGNVVPHATEVITAWEAVCADGLERANASYKAAQRNYLGNTDVLSATSRIDQLRSHAPATCSSLLTGHHPSLPSAEASTATDETESAASNTLLADLMQPEQRQPYR